jgi:peptidyl-prolyl cis-trans isomerase D
MFADARRCGRRPAGPAAGAGVLWVTPMTMLDRMRRHRNWLKWSLFIVCVAMVIFFIPNFLSDPAQDLGATDTLAVVEGQQIRGDEFRRTYQAQLQAYRTAYGDNLNDQLLRQLGVEQQILQQMVDERAAMAEADRLDIRVSDVEVRQRILSIPSFQENGVFIGEQRYQQLLAMQRPPLTAAGFEDSVRRAIMIDKLRASVTEWLSVTDKELEQEYRRRNDKVKIAVVSFSIDRFRPSVTASDEEVATYFDGHMEEFRVPEKRKIRYVLVDVDALRAKIEISPADVERAYNDNIANYTSPEQVRASHILFRLEGKDEAAVRAQAEQVLEEARGGADFAALAAKYSEDEGSAAGGGDLDYFGRGRMVPEFDNVVFTMEPGQISDLVRTPFGFHIIKLVDKKAGDVQSLDAVRPQLTEQLTFARAQEQATAIGDSLQQRITSAADLDAAAKAQGLMVQETGFFARDEPIAGLGSAPALTARVFEMNPGEVTESIQTGRGVVFATLVAKQDPYLPKLDEVKARVRDEVIRQKARDLGRRRATELAEKLKGASDFVAAAKSAGFEVQTSELITRDSPIPEVGIAPEVTDAAFRLPTGGVSDPISIETGATIVKVLEKQEVTPTELAANRDRFREELLTDRRNRFFTAYMAKAKQKMRIEVNQDALQRVVGG